MAVLEEKPEWSEVYQIELADPVLGGNTGIANKPLKNLTNRTFFLKKKMDEILQLLNLRFPVGHVIITRNIANPATYGYEGEWEREDGDLSLVSTSDDSKIGQIDGDNNQAVPLLSHNHTSNVVERDLGTIRSNTTGDHSHSSKFKGNALPNHHHNYSKFPRNNHYSGTGRPVSVNESLNHNQVEISFNTNSVSAGTPSGSVSLSNNGNHYHDTKIGKHSHEININASGTAKAQINVQGRHIKVVVWTRIS